MVTNYSAFIDVIAQLFDDRNIKCCVTESFKGGLLTGCSAFVGGVLLGPVGLAVGSIVGGVAAASSSKGKFESAGSIIRQLPQKKKEELYRRLAVAIGGINIEDVIKFSLLLLSNSSFSDLAIKEVKNYLSNEMNAKFQ